jgi:rhodanese-related sulfurtransferase
MRLLIFITIILLLGTRTANAFLPPEFFVQGLSSIWMVIAGGVAVALAPFIVFFKFIKVKFRTHKKIIIYILIQNILLAGIVGIFFYYKFYKPLYEDSYLFPQGHGMQVNMMGELDPSEFNDNYIIKEGAYRDLYNDINEINEKFALSIREIEEKIKKNEKIYFIDVREIEEYNAGHVDGSKHYRGMDLTLDKIKEIFNLSEEGFGDGVFVLICHDGGRGLVKAEEFNMGNIKYIYGGIEVLNGYNGDLIKLTGPVFADYKIFDEKYQTKYQMKASEAIKKIKNNEDILLIDGRHKEYYDKGHIQGSIQLNIGRMTTEEYNQSLNKILEKKGSELIIYCNRYGELFHATLLFLRLERDYGLNDNRFNIVFNQLDQFKDDPEIEFEGI